MASTVDSQMKATLAERVLLPLVSRESPTVSRDRRRWIGKRWLPIGAGDLIVAARSQRAARPHAERLA
jgi:hypothetical protein